MLSLIGVATSEPPMPAPFLTLIATCRPVQMGDFGIGSVLNGECKAMRCCEGEWCGCYPLRTRGH